MKEVSSFYQTIFDSSSFRSGSFWCRQQWATGQQAGRRQRWLLPGSGAVADGAPAVRGRWSRGGGSRCSSSPCPPCRRSRRWWRVCTVGRRCATTCSASLGRPPSRISPGLTGSWPGGTTRTGSGRGSRARRGRPRSLHTTSSCSSRPHTRR